MFALDIRYDRIKIVNASTMPSVTGLVLGLTLQHSHCVSIK